MVKALYQPFTISVALLALAIGSGFKSALWLGWLLVAVALGLPVMATVEYIREDRVTHSNPLTLHVHVSSQGTRVNLNVVCTNPTTVPIDNCRVVLGSLSRWNGKAWEPAKWFQPWSALAWADSSVAPESRSIGPDASVPVSIVQIGGELPFPFVTYYASRSKPLALNSGFYQAHLEVHASPRHVLTAAVCFHADDDTQALRPVPVPSAEGLINWPGGNL